MERLKKQHRWYPKVTRRDLLITSGICAVTCILCFLLSFLGDGTNYAPMIFVLSVFMTARFTNGYVYGIVMSLVDVLLVNYVFTYPYFTFNFTLAGYPITFISSLAVSLTTSALTSRAKQSEKIRMEADREKTRSNLLRAVSHDLRTPLTSILGAISAVSENDEALSHEERVALLHSAQDDAQWLIRIVENLLAVTRVDSGGSRVVKTPEAAEEVLAAALAKFKKRFPEVNVQAQVPDEFLMVPMDSLLIEQVIGNLLENAVLHGKNADQIRLSVYRRGQNAVFEVRDNGCGISPEKLKDIRDGKSVSAGTSGDSHRNMGIGLSVCHSIIKAHGGSLYAENAPEGGAVFSFDLALEENYE
ncbi:MAG: DUF4118 domain-containing protein [Clostridia bacterium]|nr:DUF4118 domain-containing protein [Clostridia bacterium]